MSHNLRTIRRMRDLTQEQLAVLSGVSQSVVSKIERGVILPMPSICAAKKRIALALGMSETELFQEKD